MNTVAAGRANSDLVGIAAYYKGYYYYMESVHRVNTAPVEALHYYWNLKYINGLNFEVKLFKFE